MVMCQILVILSSFSDHENTQGHVSDPEVMKLILDYHPVPKLWTEAIKC